MIYLIGTHLICLMFLIFSLKICPKKDGWSVLSEHRYSFTNTILNNVVLNVIMVSTKMVSITEISALVYFTGPEGSTKVHKKQNLLL